MVMKTTIASAALALMFTLGLAGAAHAAPAPTMPGTVTVLAECSVDTDLTATACQPTSAENSGDQAKVLADLNVHPEYLAGATPGARVLVLIRRSLTPPADGAPGWSRPPASRPPLPAGAPVLLADPDWQVVPQNMAYYYPDRAARNGVGGSASAVCSVSGDGFLVGCWIAAETPANMGFRFATLYLTRLVRMNAVSKSGAPVGGRVLEFGALFKVRGDEMQVNVQMLAGLLGRGGL